MGRAAGAGSAYKRTKGAGSAYKRRTAEAWDEVAPRYHRRWAGAGAGPFGVVPHVVEAAGIGAGDRVLDLACGTGSLTRAISAAVGPGGAVVGADASRAALRIARRFAGARNARFVQADAETVRLRGRFDSVTCQYALFYFPDSRAALRNAGRMLKEGGTLAAAVHGDRAPFFTCILDAAAKFVPGYSPPGSPDLNRFGRPGALAAEAEAAGFSGARVERIMFRHSPGTFGDYRRGHVGYVARAQRERLAALARGERAEFWEEVRKNAAPYTARDGRITFPWEVLVLSARR